MSHTFYNSFDLTCKSPFGAVKAGQPVTFNLTVPEDLGYVDPHLVLTKDCEDPVHYRMEFTGQSVDAPLLSETARRFNVNNNIISAQMDYAGGVKFGIMLTEMHGTQEETQAAIAWLQEHHVKVEVLGYV